MKGFTFPLVVIAALGMALFAGPAQAGIIVLSNNFDGGATVGPAFQGLSNGVGTGGSGDPATGVIITGAWGSSARGLNTESALDLSGYTEFTIDWVVSVASNVGSIEANGWFFGVTSSTATDADGLWNNNPARPAVGLLMLSPSWDDWSLAVNNSGGIDTTRSLGGSVPTNASFEDGFALSLTLKNDDTWSASSTGLSNNITNTDGTLPTGTYADLAGTVVANTSVQGENISYTVGSVTITAVPEPGAWLLFLVAAACGLLVRRRRGK